jgi:hypothetical protein
MTVATMGTEDGVIAVQMSAHAGCDCLLANISMTRTMDQASLVGTGQFFFRLADDLHRAIEEETDILRNAMRQVHGLGGFCW